MKSAEDIARLEKAEGPDRLLDLAIHAETGPLAAAVIKARGAPPSDLFSASSVIPRYTASLDSALTLVPEGYAWAADKCRLSCEGFVCIDDGHTKSDGYHVVAATVPLAICIASLQARDAIAKGGC